MVIRIESLEIDNLRSFRGDHRVDFGQNEEAGLDVITGNNGTGKTTLADSIYLCLTGKFNDEFSLVNYELVDELSPGEEVNAEVTVVISDSDLDRRFRFSREFKTAETRRGPVNSVESLETQEEIDGEWVDLSSAKAMNTVFPESAFIFSKLDSEPSLGVENPWGGTSWSELVESLGDAAAQQASAREIDLPEYFSKDDDLGAELLCRINSRLTAIDSRYKVEEREDGLVGRARGTESNRVVHSLAAGDRMLISQVAALACRDLMPSTPPLIGDTIFGRADKRVRLKMVQAMAESNGQIILFAIGPELEDTDVVPRFRLEKEGRNSSIEAME